MPMLDYSDNRNRILGKILAHYAEVTPESVFLAADERRITYKQAYSEACALAQGLRERGLDKGDRLCIFMGSSPEFVLVSFAANLIGAHWIPSTDSTQEESPRIELM